MEFIHFQPFPKLNPGYNEVTNNFAEKIVMVVDKLNFHGHKGAFCKANCGPRKVPELQKGIQCEQTFKWFNAFKTVTSMNEPHFFFFIIDMHNPSIEKKLRQLDNPGQLSITTF